MFPNNENTANIKNNIPNIYNTPIFIPEAIDVFPSAKELSAAALHVAH